jgi:flagellar biosynthesis/type III secretory pathway protein FliH
LACGSSRRNFNILQINQEEQINFGLRNQQRIVAVGVKNITLERINKQSTADYKLQRPEQIDLIYEFDREEQQQQIRGKQSPLAKIWKKSSHGQESSSESLEEQREHTQQRNQQGKRSGRQQQSEFSEENSHGWRQCKRHF